MIFLNKYLVRGRSKEERSALSFDILKVYYFILDENRWCKHAMARDINGEYVDSIFAPNVYSVCILGALYLMDCSEETFTYLEMCASIRKYDGLNKINDRNNHAYVIDFLKICLDVLGVIPAKSLEVVK